jgi:predicted metal-dependent hydrolase
MQTYKLELEKNRYVEFELIRKDVKNINLTVRPNFSITVSAKTSVPLEDIYKYLDSKSNWILKRIGRFKLTKSENNVEVEYVTGESLKFLGKQYRLIVELTSSTERVVITGNFIKLYVKNKNKIFTKARLIDEWYRKEARSVFSSALDKMFDVMKNKLDSKPNLEFKIMKKRWGSCLKKKNAILLNLELIKAPNYCIEYVVLHELIHFVHRNHDHNFYELLTVLMPDWKNRKKILDQEIVLYV